jgi:Tat protein translocase TatB subunit
MFGSIGGPEIILIFIVALIVFGPQQLPEIGRKIGGFVREFRRATNEFRSNVEREIGFDPVSGIEVTRKVRRDILTTVSEPFRDVTEGTVGTLKDVKTQVHDAIQSATPIPAKGAVSRSDDPGAAPAEESPKEGPKE